MNHWCSTQCPSILKARSLSAAGLYHGVDLCWVTLQHVAGPWPLRTDLSWELKSSVEGGQLLYCIIKETSVWIWNLSVLCRLVCLCIHNENLAARVSCFACRQNRKSVNRPFSVEDHWKDCSHSRLLDHLDMNYRSGHTTETALLKVSVTFSLLLTMVMQWCTEEIKVFFAENPDLTDVLRHACFVHCQEFLPCSNFCLPGPFTFIFFQIFPVYGERERE